MIRITSYNVCYTKLLRGSIGIIIAFGTVIGAYLENSGGAKTLANRTLKTIGKKRSLLGMNLTGFIVSIPVYCDSGFSYNFV